MQAYGRLRALIPLLATTILKAIPVIITSLEKDRTENNEECVLVYMNLYGRFLIRN